MKITRRRFITTASAIPFVTTSAATLLALLPQQAHAALQPVRLGYQYHLWGAPAVVALKMGFFKAEGLNVEDKRFASGVDTRSAMVGGHIDIGTVGVTPFVVGASLGELGALATVCYAGKTAMVMARSGLGIKSVADLKGRKIASQVGSTLDDVFKKRIAPDAKLGPADYEIVNVKFQDQASAVAAKSVDAMLNLEPFCSIAEEQNVAVQITDYYKYDLIPNMLAVNRPFAEKYPETCVAFLRGWLKAVDIFVKNPNDAADIMVGVYKDAGYKVSVATVRKVVGRLVVTPDFIPQLPDYLREQAAALKKAHRIENEPDPAAILLRDFLPKARAAKS